MNSVVDVIGKQDETAWEKIWSPYDAATYRAVLEKLFKDDVVLEIGAGDLRLAILMAQISRKVYAIEIQRDVLELQSQSLPDNLIVLNEDALTFPFPIDISAAVLLMRHCTHFQHYAERLKNAGCQRLITNARWGMGIEEVLLQLNRIPYRQAQMGWYACWCGSAGFKVGAAEAYSPEMDLNIQEVINCPQCVVC
ncbi:MAG: rRNA adenine methyltransferase [Anaerolineae bacterium]|nr:rRNA adenine methyltransferase [Anaerolineae bacterium]